MLNLSDTLFFLSQLPSPTFNQIGALVPTSRIAAQALVAEALRDQGPKVILEVGPGTGPITTELVRHMKSDDRLVLCEINPDFCAYLEKRFNTEPELLRVRHQVEILCRSAHDLPGSAVYDHIISAVPFVSLPVELTRQILSTYKRILKKGGTFTFIEYAFLRDIRRLSEQNGGTPSEFIQVDELLREMTDRYQFREEKVLLNFPPANVRSLRFTDVPPEVAENLSPRENYKRISIPGTGVGFNTEAADLVAVLGVAALALAKKKSKWWVVPAAMGAFAAWFHRDPHRDIQTEPNVAYAASDGRVMKVDTIRHPRLGDQDWVRIATFLSPADVHINRSPVAGKVVDGWEEPGGFLPAYQDASETNSSRFIVVEGNRGKVAVAQRAGFLARRIFTWPKKGELLTQGERYGLIRFGSRTDVLFPLGTVEVTVRPGDMITAGQTAIVRYKDEAIEAPSNGALPAG